MWLFFAFLAGVFFTIQGLVTRHVLKGEKDAWAFSFYFSLIGALVTFPFMLVSPTIPTTWEPWVLTILMGVLIVGHNLLHFKSSHHLEASVGGAASQIKLVWVLVLGVVLAHELFTWEKLLGTVFTVAAGVVILGKLQRPKTINGVWLVIASTFFYAVIIILYKYLFVSFNAVSATFFAAFLAPAIINLIMMPNAIIRISKMLKSDGKILIFACGAGALANLAQIYGLSIGDATKVLVILEAFLIFTLVGEHIFLKEKEHLWVKVVAVLFAVCGALFIRISS